MKSVTRCHENRDEMGVFPDQTVTLSVTSLIYHIPTAGGGHAA